jgi:hypothetical protein
VLGGRFEAAVRELARLDQQERLAAELGVGPLSIALGLDLLDALLNPGRALLDLAAAWSAVSFALSRNPIAPP